MVNCEFCIEFSNGYFSVDDKEIISNNSRISYEYENFFIFPSIGELEKGHQLITPREHKYSYLQLENHRKNIAILILYALRKRYYKIFNNYPIFFEHGDTSENDMGGQSIKHAHIHILPQDLDLYKDIINLLSHRKSFRGIDFDYYINEPYVLFIDRMGDSHYFTGEITSQLLRKIYASKINKTDRWNWKDNISYEEVISSALFFKKNLKDLLNGL